MLVQHCSPTFEQLIKNLDNRVKLTNELRELLKSERGATRPSLFELRGSSRFRCNGECVIVLSKLSYRMPEQEAESIAIVRDISRKGIGLISHQQWYPEQLMTLHLQNATLEVRVARVRRAGPFCFEVGLLIEKHEVLPGVNG